MTIEKGTRVLVMDGAWKGFTGEYIGMENTPVGILAKVALDNNMNTLVPLDTLKEVKDIVVK